ncbi:MAG: SAM-dependent DNA methyltransferase [Verrucomicrobia bacterium]|jgi:type I restriction enzyme M protein|nr:SAM-dependent DNA methyltransferase [Verrucomicrobiota bacterium]
MTINEKHDQVVQFLWDIAGLLHGAMSKSEHQNVILPFTVLRRLDYALADTKPKVLATDNKLREAGLENRDQALCRTSGFAFYNTCQMSYDDLLGDPDHLTRNLKKYVAGFSENVQEIFRRFRIDDVIRNLDEVDRLYLIMDKFSETAREDQKGRKTQTVNLKPYDAKDNPDGLTNHDMGMVFEELIRRYNEDINENPGEHYTPRDIIRLLVNLVLSLDEELPNTPKIRRTAGDCCSGTGGMLSTCREEILQHNDSAEVFLFGQELNPRTWAVCRSDMLLMNPGKEDLNNIKLGSTLSNDQLADRHFDYQFANPPYGFEWKPDKDDVELEAGRGWHGRFGAGLPRISDGQLLFLQHMVSHMNRNEPSYVGVVFNGSPLFTGDAGSGESQIRRWVMENDLLYALVGLPEQMFYNTGIQTYLWILTNQKPARSRGKVMLVDASGSDFWTQMDKSVGAKRREITEGQRDALLKIFRKYRETEVVRIFPSTVFGYRKIRVERPLRLNFCNAPERVERLREITVFKNLAVSKKRDKKKAVENEKKGREFQAEIIAALESMPGDVIKDREVFIGVMEKALDEAGVKARAPVKKAIIAAIGERDESAVICRDKNGDPEPDPELRDHESVRLDKDVDEYFDEEVRPHVEDAWVDRSYTDPMDGEVGKVGYEVNFNRHFFKYESPRALTDIDKDIRNAEQNILALLKEVMG